MYTQVEKPKKNKSRAVSNSVGQKKSNEKQGFGFVDNRMNKPCNVMQKKTYLTHMLPQQYTWGQGKVTAVGHSMEVYLDPAEPVRGQSANLNKAQTPMMRAIKKHYKLDSHEAVKGHLLNDNVGGPAYNSNLFPITKGANGDHLHFVENKVKSKLRKGEGVYYKVVVKGAAQIDNPKNQFITTVADWNPKVVKNDDPATGNIEKEEKRIVYSDMGEANRTKAVTDDKDQPVNTHHDVNGGELQEPAKAVGELSQTEKEFRKLDFDISKLTKSEIAEMIQGYQEAEDDGLEDKELLTELQELFEKLTE